MKSIKNLVIPGAVLLVLIVALVIYSVVSSGKNKVPTEEELSLYSPSEVESIVVEKLNSEDSTITVKCLIENHTVSNYEYTCDDAEDNLEFSQENLGSYVSILSSYYANAHVSSEGNVSEYGLDNPEYRITINNTDGSVAVVLLGDDTFDGTSCYVMLEGSKDIYSINNIKKIYASKKTIDFLSSQVLNLKDTEISNVLFERTTDNVSLKANVTVSDITGSCEYFITDPYNIKASDYFINLMEYICTLEITSFMDIPQNELAKYGLDKPAFHFYLTMNSGESVDLYLSPKLAGFYYGYIKGLDNYFMISEMQIRGLETPILTLISPYISYNTASEISSYTVTKGDQTFKFALDVNPDTSISADESTVTLDGRNAKIFNSSNRSYCAILFETLACIDIGGIETQNNIGNNYKPDLSVTIIDKNYNSNTYDFVKRNEDSYYVYANGKYTCFYVLATELFNDAGTDTYSYGIWSAYELLNKAISNNINGVYDIPENN